MGGSVIIPLIPMGLLIQGGHLGIVANRCFPTDGKIQNDYVLIPIGCIIFATAVLVLITFVKVILVFLFLLILLLLFKLQKK